MQMLGLRPLRCRFSKMGNVAGTLHACVSLRGKMEHPQADCKAGLFLFPFLIPKAKKLASQIRGKDEARSDRESCGSCERSAPSSSGAGSTLPVWVWLTG